MKYLLHPAIVLLFCGMNTLTVAEQLPLQLVDGQPLAPQFNLPGTDGKMYRLTDYRGKPLILNFWATWCPACLAEMPSLQRAHHALARDGIPVIAINVGEDAETVAEFTQRMPLPFPLPLDQNSAVAQRYPLIGLPTTFIIDAKGKIIFSALGEYTWDDPALLARVRALNK
ncbi:peroxiredoxin family protein [Chromatium okenii]|jgi:peroxiredoxin|uniref:Alkyl hydroperoxide reductase n=1 Tax=Chromatium okenii TaxID=61644 RepID=A0A2S7XR95_9GAMM|nr:TlpA disulfide reductase family protein [Chromatium okenii]PQJ95921.1 alkyl hydroperoxide reductase [Chromatium okenii]